MSNPTSNFNWQMPTATDLVTDLPADFEVFGQAVDSSMADLLGGTTGQILAKNSNTNMDFVWVTNDVGDITAVTAGTGISGGGTSGAVTITNAMATEITAKGDLIVGTGNAAFDNLPAGTNGHVLTADSTVSPTGLKWAAPAGGGKVLQVIQASTSTATTIASTTYTDTTLSATITPTSATSKILVQVVQISLTKRNTNDTAGLGIRILRDSTSIFEPAPSKYESSYLGLNAGAATSMEMIVSVPLIYLDSPASTSALTYKTQGAVFTTNNSGSSTFQTNASISTITLLEIGA